MLRRKWDLDLETIVVLRHLQLTLEGKSNTTPDGEYYDLTDSMGSDWFDPVAAQGDHLVEKELIEKIYGPQNRVYWRITDRGWRVLEDTYKKDLGEGFRHVYGIGLVTTWIRLDAPEMGDGRLADLVPDRETRIDQYTSLGRNLGKTDVLVTETPVKGDDWTDVPKACCLALEIKTDTNDTGHTLTTFERLERSGYPSLWVFDTLASAHRHINRVLRYDGENVEDLPVDYHESPASPETFRGFSLPTGEIKHGTNWDIVSERIGRTREKYLGERGQFGMHQIATYKQLQYRIENLEESERTARLDGATFEEIFQAVPDEYRTREWEDIALPRM